MSVSPQILKGANPSRRDQKSRRPDGLTEPTLGLKPTVRKRPRAPILRVLNGVQEGASLPLKPGRLLVGTAPTDDVRLIGGPGTDPAQMLLSLGKEQLHCTLIQGHGWLSGQPLVVGVPRVFRPFDVLSLVGVAFAVGHEGSRKWRAVTLPERLEAPSHPTGSAGEFSLQPTKAIKSRVLIGVSVLGMLAAVAFATGLWLILSADPDHADQTHSGQGRADSYQSSGAQPPAPQQAQPLDLLPLIVEVFRAYRIPGDLKHIQGGDFVLALDSVHLSRARQAADRVFEDIPGVDSIRFEVTDRADPSLSAASAINPSVKQGMGKKQEAADVSEVVSEGWLPGRAKIAQVRLTDVSSLLLSSGERIFEGAELESGYVLLAIEADRVLLGKNKRQVWTPIANHLAPDATKVRGSLSRDKRD